MGLRSLSGADSIVAAYINIGAVKKEDFEDFLKERCKETGLDYSKLYEFYKDKPISNGFFEFLNPGNVAKAFAVLKPFIRCLEEVRISAIWRIGADYGRVWWSYSDWLEEFEDDEEIHSYRLEYDFSKDFDDLFSIDTDEYYDASGWLGRWADENGQKELEEFLNDWDIDEPEELVEKFPQAWDALVAALEAI